MSPFNIFIRVGPDIRYQAKKVACPVSNPNLYYTFREQLYSLFEIDPEKVQSISAKLGTGVSSLLDTVVKEFYPIICFCCVDFHVLMKRGDIKP